METKTPESGIPRNIQPTRIEPYNETQMRISWSNGEAYAVPYVDIRYYCPCAGCVDEHTGERTILRSSISPDIRPENVQVVGRYAIQVRWNDQHNTGMYHFDRLYELCQRQGRKLSA